MGTCYSMLSTFNKHFSQRTIHESWAIKSSEGVIRYWNIRVIAMQLPPHSQWRYIEKPSKAQQLLSECFVLKGYWFSCWRALSSIASDWGGALHTLIAFIVLWMGFGDRRRQGNKYNKLRHSWGNVNRWMTACVEVIAISLRLLN